MKSKKRLEGYLQVDHRGTPGLPEAIAYAAGIPSAPVNFECATITCSHCQRVVILNPQRQKERNYCMGCDNYICDQCAAIKAANGGICKTFEQVIAEVQEAAVRQEQSGESVIIIP